MSRSSPRILFVKPPDRFLDNEFVYQQLGPHYLQSFLEQHSIGSDLAVLYERANIRQIRTFDSSIDASLDDLDVLLIKADGQTHDMPFNEELLGEYDIVAMSVMTPQAPDAYRLNERIKNVNPNIISVIGGSHPRYYQDQVTNLPEAINFDFVVPQDGWRPMLQIATNQVTLSNNTQVLTDSLPRLLDIPAPTRPQKLMERYNFEIGGVPAFHTITALGCPFTCYFCESGVESVRTFSRKMLDKDLETIADAHSKLGRSSSAVMFFDDVGLMSPKQVERLAETVSKYGFATWRAFTHAYLVVRHKEKLLKPFRETGGKRVGIGIETGSQKSLDLINKRNGKQQSVRDHFDAIAIANDMGIAVDAFTMIYPWEDEKDLKLTTELVEFVSSNPVNGVDAKGRPLKNHVDSTIMSPYQGTEFHSLMSDGKIAGVKLNPLADPGMLYYKGNDGGSGWPYLETRLPRRVYEEVQSYRNSLRPQYR